MILSSILSFLPIALILGLIILLIILGYIKAPPDQALIISGPGKQGRVLVGRAGFRIPFFERVDKLNLGAIQIDVKTATAVPTADFINVKVDSTVSVRVGRSDEMIRRASQNFLNTTRKDIAQKINDLLEGNIREIIGQMSLTDMVSNRKLFSQKVQENAVPDLEALGLELITFNVQNFNDNGNVIENLGIDNTEQIRKRAAIAKSDAAREIAVAQSANDQAANEAHVKAEQTIAERNTALAIQKAELQTQADTRQAQADAAKSIEAEKQRQLRDVAAAQADTAQAEAQVALKEKQIALKERELDAIVRKEADAKRYAAEQEAQAKRYAMEQEAEARKQAAIADAEAIRVKGEAEAAAIQAKGEAEAAATEKKAEAYRKMGEASIVEMVMNALPKMTEAAANSLSNVESITMYGDDAGSRVVKDVTGITNQIFKGLAANGIDVQQLVKAALANKHE